MPTSYLFTLLQFLAKADSYAMRKEAALAREAKALRKRLEVIIDNMDLNEFLGTLMVADQTVQRARVEPLEFDHPRFYWIFKNMDYHQWFAGDSKVLLLSGPTECTLDRVSSHISGLMEEGRFGKDRIVLNFFSPDGATIGGNRPRRRKQHSGPTATIFTHTLLHQIITSASVSGRTGASTASDFLSHLLGSIENLELLDRFEGFSGGDTLTVIEEVLDVPDMILFEALEGVLETQEALGIVVNVSDNVRGRGSGFLTDVATFVGRLSETPGIKVLLTCGPVEDSGKTLGGLDCIKIQYDKERKGLIHNFLTLA
jgi:hypothetical protein